MRDVAARDWHAAVLAAREDGYGWFDWLGCVDEIGVTDELRVVLSLRRTAEPGESAGSASPSRRRTVPPGVPPAEVWGDRDATEPAPDPAEVAASVSGGRVRRRPR